MRYEEIDKFMTDYINPDGSLDSEGTFYRLKETFEENKDRLTANVPTLYFVDELLYRSFRNRAEFLNEDYPSKAQLVKWFKEKNFYDVITLWIEKKRKDRRRFNSGTLGNKGGGRPPVENPRKKRTLRATEEEWELIKDFANQLKNKKENIK